MQTNLRVNLNNMHADPATFISVTIIFFMLMLGFLMQKLRQPTVVAYLIVGILLGPSCLGMVTDQASLARLGELGVILLLFFVGMEVSPQNLASNWLIAIIGTLLQTLFSIAFVIIPSFIFKWPWPETILIGFVISLSSTAVVLNLLNDWKELESRTGQNVLGILIVQDLLIIPMLIILSLFKGDAINYYSLFSKIVVGLIIMGFGGWLLLKTKIHLPIIKKLARDHESQVLVSLLLCFGMALATSLLGLSTALGAFIAGMFIATTKETHWVHESLMSLKTICMAVFFVSIGLLVDLKLIWSNFFEVMLLVLAAFTTNTILNAGILRLLRESWQDSIYGASLLAQIGEFSFVLVSIGLASKLIDINHYKMLISVIAVSLIFSPVWIALTKRFAGINSEVRQLNSEA